MKAVRKTLHRFAALIAVVCSLAAGPRLAAAEVAQPAAIDFARQIRPILSDNCFSCHGPDEQARKSKLRLDTKDGAFAAGKSGEIAIVPGHSSKSEIIARIISKDEEAVMPPPKSGKKLTAEQLSLLKRWIEEGAAWQSHWAFEAPKRPEVPAPKGANWTRNEIDRFILARLEQEGLQPSQEADKARLIRRVTYDLTGLPPQPEEVEAFTSDRGADAYEKVVDRLLKSPRYGEHMARYWLDAARYADTHGLHIDTERSMWKYRDWVVDAFNANKPFDQFTIEQLAGDLLPDATPEQKTASGYIRANMTTGEGGAITEEYQAKYTFDRAEAMSTTWLGLTLTCARCHTHKYDPITHKEYYGLFAFFNNLDEAVMDGNVPNPHPSIRVPSAEQSSRIEELKKHIAESQGRFDKPVAEFDKGLAAFEASWKSKATSGWSVPRPASVKSANTNGVTFETLADQSVRVAGFNPEKDTHTVTLPLAEGEIGALRLETFPDAAFEKGGAGRGSNGVFRVSEIEAEIVTVDKDGKRGSPQKVAFAETLSENDAAKLIDGKADSGWKPEDVAKPASVLLVPKLPMKVASAGELVVRLKYEANTNAQSLGHFRLSFAQDRALVDVLHPIRESGWQKMGVIKIDNVAEAYAKSYAVETSFNTTNKFKFGEKDFSFDGKPTIEDGKTFRLVNAINDNHGLFYFSRKVVVPVDGDYHVRILADDTYKLWVNGVLTATWGQDDIRQFTSRPVTVRLRTGENQLLLKVANLQGDCRLFFDGEFDAAPGLLPADLARQLAILPALGTDAKDRLKAFWYQSQSLDNRKLARELTLLREEQSAVDAAVPTTMIAKERDKVRETHLLVRGEYDQKGEVIPPGLPSILPPMPRGAPTNRLGLAKWLVDPSHPLTARVTVNRYWQQYFGNGFVKTSEDFGAQGEPPSHPELFDWLSTEFVRSGWDIRHIQRLIVTSATYRQSSKHTPTLVAKDPENRLLARGPRFRFDAETLRDTALSVSGLMIERRGGRSVKAWEPAGLWEAVSYRNSQSFVADRGEGQYRRSLYTYWKRQSPPPNMLILDAPTRESCVVKRPRTNTPLQALALLNDPQFVEPARAFAQRVIREGGKTPRSRLEYAFMLVTSRKPTRDEAKVLEDVLAKQTADFRKSGDAAGKLLNVGEFVEDPSLNQADLAAWTTIASMLLNLDETVTKG